MLDVLLPVSLMFIMFNIGLELTPADFRRVIEVPRGIGIGLVNLILISPLLAALVATIFNLDPVLAVGLVLLGSAPGGALANLYTSLAKGETALLVSLTAISSVICVITIPIYLSLADQHFGGGNLISDVNMAGVGLRVLAITLVPLSAGMYVHAKRSEWTKRNKSTMDRVTMVVFILVVIAAVASEFDVILNHFTEVALACLTLNLAAMSFSFFSARALKVSERAATAISLELGIHNAAVAITVGNLLGNDSFIIPAGVYSLFMFANGALFARFMYKRNVKSAEVATAEAAG